MGLLQKHDRAETVPVPIIEVCRGEGITVLETRFKEPGIAGMIIGREGRFTTYVNRDEPNTRERFTIAHELGHYVLHLQGHLDEGGFRDDRSTILTAFRQSGATSPLEREANQFAAEILMPEPLIREYAPISDPMDLGRIFGVSAEAMRIRLDDVLSIRR